MLEAMVLMRGAYSGTLYKLLGNTINDGCNKCVFLDGNNEKDMTSIVLAMLWHQTPGHIGEKGLQALHGKCMKVCSIPH